MKAKFKNLGYWVLVTAFAFGLYLLGCWTVKNMMNEVFVYYGIKETSTWCVMLVIASIWVIRKLILFGEEAKG